MYFLTGPYKQLAMGSDKGSIVLYNKRQERKNALPGKHSTAIIDGSWSQDNLLALASEDKQISVSDTSGAPLCSVEVKMPPTNLQVCS